VKGQGTTQNRKHHLKQKA